MGRLFMGRLFTGMPSPVPFTELVDRGRRAPQELGIGAPATLSEGRGKTEDDCESDQERQVFHRCLGAPLARHIAARDL